MDNNNLKLEEGEIICSECEGRGTKPSSINSATMASICKKCQGDGKLDWIENIVGKVPKLTGFFGSSSTSGHGISQKDLDFMSKQLADKIDNEILETMRIGLEQKDDKMKAAATVFRKIGGSFFDNRIIS